MHKPQMCDTRQEKTQAIICSRHVDDGHKVNKGAARRSVSGDSSCFVSRCLIGPRANKARDSKYTKLSVLKLIRI